MPIFESFLFVDSVHVYIAEPFDLASKRGYFFSNSLPIDLLVGIVLVGLSQLDLQLIPDPLNQVLLPYLQLAQFYLKLIGRLLGLAFLGTFDPNKLLCLPPFF